MAEQKERTTLVSEVRRLLRAGDERRAILLAARFPRLGEERNRILSAREAYNRPEFQRELGRDPAALIADGVAALKEKYGI